MLFLFCVVLWFILGGASCLVLPCSLSSCFLSPSPRLGRRSWSRCRWLAAASDFFCLFFCFVLFCFFFFDFFFFFFFFFFLFGLISVLRPFDTFYVPGQAS